MVSPENSVLIVAAAEQYKYASDPYRYDAVLAQEHQIGGGIDLLNRAVITPILGAVKWHGLNKAIVAANLPPASGYNRHQKRLLAAKIVKFTDGADPEQSVQIEEIIKQPMPRSKKRNSQL